MTLAARLGFNEVVIIRNEAERAIERAKERRQDRDVAEGKGIRIIERAKAHLHVSEPANVKRKMTDEEADTAVALRTLDKAWIECQRAAGR